MKLAAQESSVHATCITQRLTLSVGGGGGGGGGGGRHIVVLSPE